ncbi:2-oxoglutarate dehydrogenase, E2 component, dihydrolipoamide succinyltransferase [Streptomyces sp. NBC_00264]|uniref:2-oxoglutarate dehydrogenase, E2 component, dihydrolipoamide succinyltransferase n=1 Tax=unclassified Streptomyces TaxID=2593676 RepID=UPI000F5BE42A|nr:MULTISPECIES: 2-oxoglutarate dehydrogenase, E2 component, dihydrolipoamide succinyltransferase [unclassified Streptomyces]MCX5159718.1 2-oxoglutarate dehydrogenase, E2 component, dihydrolipoamide succinyltransferase [Streptomyces sp. NBC_00305]MCX5218241.1 2-oxoglutarate dehydrogenase, E2 component, dihydrolipoamide succinyltransferase [Streptomyces sp. NBC_00264]RPK72546.1 Dihydrolipoyllysine-residue acetyltransferase component of pyruvate dehydrogenase complex [Streptomyces sp. ADI95-17]WS
MSVSVTLPALGESVTEGTVTRWLKAEGERVEADEPLLEVSTDKVDTEIPAPAAGILAAIKVAEDETVEVGAELAIIDDGTGAPAAAAAPAAEPAAAPAPAPVAEAPAAAPAPAAEAPAPAAAPAGGAAGTDVTLPALGESVTEGTVTRWLKEVGEEVTEDEPLLEVSTDKVDTEIPAPVSGVLLEIVVAEDETAEVGAKLAVIGAAGAAPAAAPAPAAPAPVAAPAPAPAAPAPAPAPVAPAAPAPAPAPVVPAAPAAAPAPVAAAPVAAPAPVTPAAPAAPSGDDGAYVTPLVRKLAAENGVDLGAVKGTGVGGRIRKQDVVAAAEAARAAAAAPAPAAAVAPAASKAPKLEASPLRGQTVKMTRMRKVIGENMMKALHSQAQLTSVVEVDVTKLMKLRNKAKDAFAAREGVKLSPMPFYVKAAAQALKAHPVVNARINEDEGTITYFDSENIGIAVDAEKGLMTPVIKGAGDLNIAGISKKTAELAGKARGGGLTPDDMSGATFTISNTGSRGALFDTVIVPPNQAAILGIGATVKRPAVIETEEGTVIGVRDMTYLSLSYDHRLVDGADAARYLTSVKAILEAGEFEVELGL